MFRIISSKQKLLYLIGFIFLFFVGIGASFVSGQDYFDVKEQTRSHRPWPKANLKDNNLVSDSPWKTLQTNRYYSWSDVKNQKGLQVFASGVGELTNDYGTIQPVEKTKKQVVEKDLTYTLPDGEVVYYYHLQNTTSNINQNGLFNNVLELEYYDRFGGDFAYADWVVSRFYNRKIPGSTVVFSGDTEANIKNKLRQGANGEGEWAKYVGKNADPDSDGFWAPYGGSSVEQNKANGAGEGSSDREEFGANDKCLSAWVNTIEAGGSIEVDFYGPRHATLSSMEDLFRELGTQGFGFQNLVKCGEGSSHGSCLPSNPGETRVQQEPFLFGGIAQNPNVSMNCPGFNILDKDAQYQVSTNNQRLTFSHEWDIAVPILREGASVWIGNESRAQSEVDIVVESIYLQTEEEGTLFDSDNYYSEETGTYPFKEEHTINGETFTGIRMDSKSFRWEYDIEMLEGQEYFDFTTGNVEIVVVNPWTDITDSPDTRTDELRQMTYLAGYETGPGPEEVPINYYSRCGKQDPSSGKIKKVLCEHEFPHTKDSGVNGPLAFVVVNGRKIEKALYTTGNYLDVNGDRVVDDLVNSNVVYTNYEEFVWDTDPLASNSSPRNNLTYGDEMYIAGVGQYELTLSKAYQRSLEKKTSDEQVSVEGTTQIPMDTYDDSFWIGTVETDDTVYQPYSLDVSITAVNNQNGGWNLPNVGQKVSFTAVIGEEEDEKVLTTSTYDWFIYFREKNSSGDYTLLDSKEGTKGLHIYDEFNIEKEGSYRVEVKVADIYDHSGTAYFDFDVNGDFIVEHPLGVRGDLMTVEANLAGLGLDDNTPIIWKIDGDAVTDNYTPILEFIITKNPAIHM